MFRQVSKVALVVLLAIGSLTVAAAEPDAAGGKTNSPPKELTVDLGKGVKLEMVLIPAGEFVMGSPDSDKDANPDEKPQHRVRITKPFYLGKYLVTHEQWEAVMGNNPSKFKGPKTRWRWLVGTTASSSSPKSTRSLPLGSASFSCPAKRSGNMPAGRGARRDTALGTMKSNWANMRGMERTRTTRPIR